MSAETVPQESGRSSEVGVLKHPPLVHAAQWSFTRIKERVIYYLLTGCALLSVLTTMAIIFVLVTEAVVAIPGVGGERKAFFQEVSLKQFFGDTEWTPQYAEKHYGIWPLLVSTFLIAGIAGLIGLPVGLMSAVYLSEYASPKARSILKPVLEILAGIPTVVYGFFALTFVTPYLLRWPLGKLGIEVEIFNAASAGIVVGIMIIPMVCSLSEDALRAVPVSLRQAGLALGGTKFQVATRVTIPAAFSGVIASFLLAISRAVGETMAVYIAAGQKSEMTVNPLRGVQTMTGYIVNVSTGDTPVGSVEYKSIYAVALTLFCITLIMNVISQWVMRRFREVYH